MKKLIEIAYIKPLKNSMTRFPLCMTQSSFLLIQGKSQMYN